MDSNPSIQYLELNTDIDARSQLSDAQMLCCEYKADVLSLHLSSLDFISQTGQQTKMKLEIGPHLGHRVDFRQCPQLMQADNGPN